MLPELDAMLTSNVNTIPAAFEDSKSRNAERSGVRGMRSSSIS